MNHRRMQITTFLVCVTCFGTCLNAADWRQFRGPGVDGLSADKGVPTKFSENENVAWVAKLEHKGISCPIVVGDKVFVTESSGFNQDRLHVHCLDAATGQKIWERRFWATGRTQCHDKMAVATPTPASDGQHVVAFYSSNDLVCLDLDGNLKWFRGLTFENPNASNSLGMSSSPIIVDGVVVAQVESDADAYAFGIDIRTGKSLWKLDRPRRANWTSPTYLTGADGKATAVLLQSSAGVSAVEPKTGKELWTFGDGASTIPSSVVSGNTIFVPSNGITALKPIEASSAPELLWQKGNLSPATASPLVSGDRLYVVNRAGVLNCASTKDGNVIWRLRLTGPFSGTPVLADGHLFFVSEKGLVQVVKLGDDAGEIVLETELKDRFISSPAVADGALYLRGDDHLWKIGQK